MSFSDLQQFCMRLRKDRALEARISVAMQQGTAAVVAAGKRAGYSFSEEELSVTLAAHDALQKQMASIACTTVVAGSPVPLAQVALND
ncbi:nif11-like leader peptide domain-containing protein [Rhizobium sp. RU35A]|uniref:Nif11 family protein n=1 Tax=Rhizobium straminoryzae TaxID=1387186 RepID=A0A549TA07_9HYPH|nr:MULTISPECIES: Nif11-like leader peptide family natural product precursor [Rhizobium]TRL38692.1 Nif11 family protein [Rhizobium straminoryzae]SIQ36746.1 nif11-like leader peptide domain-containing protein [Rhizobium sp. RU35A]